MTTRSKNEELAGGLFRFRKFKFKSEARALARGYVCVCVCVRRWCVACMHRERWYANERAFSGTRVGQGGIYARDESLVFFFFFFF